MTCPNCGFCPSCGRSNIGPLPYVPPPGWVIPEVVAQPTWVWTGMTTPDLSILAGGGKFEYPGPLFNQ